MNQNSNIQSTDSHRVSVVIPYSPEHTPAEMLNEAKESVESQSVPTEIIVIKDTEQRGPAWARNQGLEQANSRFVAFLDSDDKWKQYKLQRQLELLEEYEAGICVEGNTNHESGPVSTKMLVERLLFYDLSSLTSSILIDRTQVETRFREDMKRKEDHLFIIEAAIDGDACLIPSPVVDINKHDEGLSAQTKPEQTHRANLQIAEYLTEYAETKQYCNQIRQKAHYGLGRQKQLQGEYLSSTSYLIKSLSHGLFIDRKDIFIKSIAALALQPILFVKNYH